MSHERSLNRLGRVFVAWPADLRRRGAIAALGMFIAVALLIFARRMAGALENPLEPAALLAAGAVTAAMAATIRLGWRSPQTASPITRMDWAVMLLTLLAVLTLGIGLCVAGSPPGAKLFMFALLAAEEGWAWAWHLAHRRTAALVAAADTSMPPIPSMPVNVCPVQDRPVEHADVEAEDVDDELPPGEVVQRLTRSRAADGSETVAGRLRVPLAAGQRTGSVHVAFCPPLAAVPKISVEQLDGPESRIKTAQLLPYGVRFDLKLADAAEEPAFVLLRFTARTATNSASRAD